MREISVLLLALFALACGHVEPPPGTAERAVALCDARSESLPATAFSTDGCSAWPDGDYRDCCIEHDIVYWCGGSKEERAAADRELRSCVAERRSGTLAWLMWTGVRAGGYRGFPLPWRWGYGRRWPAPYSEARGEACGETD